MPPLQAEDADKEENGGRSEGSEGGEAFSPARVAQQFGRVAAEGLHLEEERRKLGLSPEAQAQLPHPT